MENLYRGTLVRLCMEDPEVMAKAFARWDRDTECNRLGDSNPARLFSEKKLKDFVEKKQGEEEPKVIRFAARSLADDQLIGIVSLFVASWTHSEAWLGIMIGERDYWDKGYGSDMLRLILRYGFVELNLRRVTLGLHSYNARAQRAYEKVGFIMEGRLRGEGLRDGQRYDGLVMGILREEWFALNGVKP